MRFDPAKPMPPMALFILALFARGGGRTVYDLKKMGQLSYGGIRPVLKSLQDHQYISKSIAQGERGKNELIVTPAGLSALNRDWTWALRQGAGHDLETVLRLAWVARLMADEAAEKHFLHKAAETRETALALRREKEKQPLAT